MRIFRGSRSGVGGVRGLKLSLLINEVILPGLGEVPRRWERDMRQRDMVMLVAAGAKERTSDEFADLLKGGRLEIRDCKGAQQGRAVPARDLLEKSKLKLP